MKNNHTKTFADKGFYIILCICALAIGISGYILFHTPEEATAEDYTQYDQVVDADLDILSDLPVADIGGGDMDAPAASQEELPEKPEETKPDTTTEERETAAPAEPILFADPLGRREVLKTFSGDNLVFDATMNDWRIHTGLDLKGNLGDRVYAAAEGTVTKVYTDGLYGTCVALDVGQNTVCVYTGLNEKVKVKEGDAVKGGDIIGTLGDTNLAEAAEESHLHFEVLRDDVRIDPMELLQEASE